MNSGANLVAVNNLTKQNKTRTHLSNRPGKWDSMTRGRGYQLGSGPSDRETDMADS